MSTRTTTEAEISAGLDAEVDPGLDEEDAQLVAGPGPLPKEPTT
ncbi:hypothetical protein ACFZB9_02805 [Kitasatospora sp. NPDC008050]